MDAERAIELLPWYVNGGLEPDERREVADALAASADVRRELAEVRRAFELHGYRLEPDVLLDYVLGLEPEGVSRETVERLAGILPTLREELDLVREGLEALGSVGPDATTGRPMPKVGEPWRRWAVAASLLAAAFLAAWAWSSHRLSLRTQELQLVRGRLEAVDSERAELSRHVDDLRAGTDVGGLVSADLTVADVFPAGTVLRGGDAAPDATTIVPRGAERAVLLLNSRLPETSRVSNLVLRDGGGVEVWRSREPVRRGEHGEFALLLPLADLTSGDYTLELLGGAEEAPTVLEVYRLRLG
ncbi:MAG: hypothetical protein R2991_06075 [Thermoanaerobaculia bacterium]